MSGLHLFYVVVVAIAYTTTLRDLLRQSSDLNLRVQRRFPRHLLQADRVLSIAMAVVLAAVWTPFVILGDLWVLPQLVAALVEAIGTLLDRPRTWFENLLVALVVWARRGFGRDDL